MMNPDSIIDLPALPPLPSRVTFQTLRQGEGVDFRVASEEGKSHLLGRLEQEG